jgi:hypothetical protein
VRKLKVWLKRIFLVTLVIVSSLTGYFFGYSEGTIVGYSEGLNSDASARAYSNVSVLEIIRNGEIEKATKLLEFKLDDAILNHGIWLKSHQSNEKDQWYTEKTDLTKRSMGKVSAYRNQYPSNHTDPELRRRLDAVINNYSKN